MDNEIPREVLMPSTKYEGLSYPTHFLKSMGSVNRNNFLKYRTKQATFLRDETICLHCSLQIKQNIYSIGIFHAPVVTQFIVKYKEKSQIVPIFRKFTISLLVNIFQM